MERRRDEREECGGWVGGDGGWGRGVQGREGKERREAYYTILGIMAQQLQYILNKLAIIPVAITVTYFFYSVLALLNLLNYLVCQERMMGYGANFSIASLVPRLYLRFKIT